MSVQININDHPLTVDKGITILQAARQNKIDIPTLCDFPGLPPHGSCRICIVEIQGRQITPTSCTTPVEEGMVIYTHSPKVKELRRELIKMLLAEHPSGCLFCPEKNNCDECMVTLRKAAVTTGCGSCPKDSQCELQALSEQHGIENPGYPTRYRMIPVEKMDPFFDRDYNLCILCGRCIRICEDLHFANVLAYTKRGTHSLVGTAFHQTHLEASCTFCGTCVEVCPTGALSEKTRKWDGKPERQTDSTCILCGIGCQVRLLAKKERIIGSLPNRSAGVDALCVKGRFGITELVNHPLRLKQPQKRIDNTWVRTGWEEAIHAAVEQLSACPPERFQLQISASCTNEDLYVASRFTREVMQSPNFCTSAQASFGVGIEQVARVLRQSQPLEAVHNAAAVLCLGLEDRYAQSVVEVQLKRSKALGAKIIALGARKQPWSSHADEWIQTSAGQEAVLVQKLAEWTASDDLSIMENSALARAACLLKQPGHPVVILGPAALMNPGLLQAVELLIQNLHAQVVALPEQGNLAGVLRLGLLSHLPNLTGQNLDLLYLIGEALPSQFPVQPFIIYQNIYPPDGGLSGDDRAGDLLLPAAAFTETEGTFIDSAGRLRAIHPAVRPVGEAMPNWLILSRIAQAMGALGFDYNSVEDIQAEISGWGGAPLLASLPASSLPASSPPASSLPVLSRAKCDPPGEHIYMGYPLARWVEGLRMLYPEEISEEGL